MDSHQDPVALRVAMVVHSYYPLDPRVRREAEALLNAGVAVDVICLRQTAELKTETVGGAGVYRLAVRRDPRRGPVRQLLEYLAFLLLSMVTLSVLHLRKRYCAVQVHNLPNFLVFAALVPRITGCRVILDIHDLMPEFFCAKFDCSPRGWLARLARAEERLSCRFAHHVITVTDWWRDRLITRGVPAGKCTVVMNAPDTRYFSRSGAGGGTRRAGEFHLIYYGAITHRYGIDLAIQALHRLRDHIPEVRLTLHGRGDYLGSAFKLVQELRLEDVVSLKDEIPPERLAKLVLSADVGLVPYRRNAFTDDLLPTKLLEYVELDLPAIVARTSAMRACFDETMVEFFTPGDIDDLARCIHKLYKDPRRREELAANAKTFCARCNWESESAAYVALVRRLAAALGPGAAAPQVSGA